MIYGQPDNVMNYKHFLHKKRAQNPLCSFFVFFAVNTQILVITGD